MTRSFSVLLGSCYEFAGGDSGALFGSPFLFDVLGALRNFVIDRLDFSSEMKIFRIP
jgi:hypothetical protein